jgi:hypothetical protein
MNASSPLYLRLVAAVFSFAAFALTACQSSVPPRPDNPTPPTKEIPFVRGIPGHPGLYAYTREPMHGYLDCESFVRVLYYVPIIQESTTGCHSITFNSRRRRQIKRFVCDCSIGSVPAQH